MAVESILSRREWGEHLFLIENKKRQWPMVPHQKVKCISVYNTKLVPSYGDIITQGQIRDLFIPYTHKYHMISRTAKKSSFLEIPNLIFLIVNGGYIFIKFGGRYIKLFLFLNNKRVPQPHGFWELYKFWIKEIPPPGKWKVRIDLFS